MATVRKAVISLKRQGSNDVLGIADSDKLAQLLDSIPKGTVVDLFLKQQDLNDQFVGNYKVGELAQPPKPDPEVPPVTPPAAGTLLYNSDTDIDWIALEKQLTAGKDYVRFDKIYGDQSKIDSGYIRTNASGNPRLLLFPKTKEICLEHDGEFGRLYFGKKNYNCKVVTAFKIDSADNGLSIKVRNRHQFRDWMMEVKGYTKKQADAIANELCQGGQGMGLRVDSVDNDLEVWHGKEIGGPSKKGLPKFEVGVYQNIEFSAFDKNGKIHIIDTLNGKVICEGDVAAPSQFMKKSDFDEFSEFWVRYNTKKKANNRLFVKGLKLYAL